MVRNPITITAKNGREVVLRSPEERDAEGLINLIKETAAETPYLIREPEEVTLTLEQEREFIKGRRDSEREMMLVAEMDGRILGCCSLMSVGAYRRYRHRCEVAIALYQEFCGLGIGNTMLLTLLEEAKGAGYEQAELEVIATNERAIALYEALGFQRYGTMPRNMKYADGTYADAFWMTKRLGE